MTENHTFMRVPYGMSVHGEEEIEAVLKVLRKSTQMGNNVMSLEKKIASFFDKKFGLMVNSGSSALLLAFEILDLPKGSEVITPALTFSTTVSSIIKAGLIPSFVDVKKDTYCIEPRKIEKMITKKTKAICAPNLIGNLADWKEINKIAKKHNLLLIEDSADTLGGAIDHNSSGSYSDISITSFYGSHVVNGAGNGGMLCLNDENYLKKAKLLRSWGRSSSLFKDSEAIENRFNVNLDGIEYDAKFVFESVGYNLEPSEVSAAFALVQLNNLDLNIQKRIENFEKQIHFFSDYKHFFSLPIQLPNSKTGWLAFPIIVKDSAPFKRRDLQIFLEKRNIQTRVVFTGNINRQPGFRDIPKKIDPTGYPESDYVMRGGMLLACHHGLTGEMMKHVHQSVKLFLDQY